MANDTNTTKKVHLTRPSNERRAMCGKTTNIEETSEPRKVTCLACRKLYDANKKWYSAAKRKQTLAAKA